MTHRLLTGRLRVLLLTAIAALAIAAVTVAAADAKKVKVAGSTEVTPSAGLNKALANNGVTLSPIAPATAAGGKLTFPIKRGRVNPQNLRGTVVHNGGIKLTKGDRKLALRRFTVISKGKGKGASLFVRVRGHRLKLAHLRNVTQSSAGGTVTVTANIRLTRRAAKAVNRRLGAKVAKGGALLGSAEVTATAAQ